MSLSAIKKKREYEELLTKYVEDLKNSCDKNRLADLATYRNFPVSILEECDIFYIADMVDMMLPQYLENLNTLGVISKTNNKPIFNNRYIIPIKTSTGMVQNLVGYSPNYTERYIYGTAEYYRRGDTLWGLENIKLAYELGYAILTEGITDSIRLRAMGYKNSFAMCGTQESDFNMVMLNRCRYGVIKIPDRDKAGKRAVKNWKCNRSLMLNVSVQYKDADEMCRHTENVAIFKEYMEACIDWIKKETHNGRYFEIMEVTIV